MSKKACLELHEIRRIRNAFAHNFMLSSFDASEVASRCHNLEMWQTIKMTMRPANDEKQGRVVVQVGDAPDEEVGELPVIDVLEFGEVKTARERFIASCQFYIAVFSIIVSEHPSLRSPLI